MRQNKAQDVGKVVDRGGERKSSAFGKLAVAMCVPAKA